jgi:hypothetical protein
VEEKAPKRRGGRYFLIFFVVVIVLLIDAVYVGVRLGTNLVSTADELERTRDLLAHGRLEEARKVALAALDKSDKADGLGWHPAVVVGHAIPWVRDDVQALLDMASAANEVAKAAVTGVRLASTTSEEGGSPGSLLYRDGAVQLDVASAAVPAIERVTTYLTSAHDKLAGAPQAHIGLVNEKLNAARADIDLAQSSAEKARAVLAALPELLGADGPKRYFLAFQSPSEARGTGGLIGFYGVLVAKDGHLDLKKVAPIDTLGKPRGRVPAPGWFTTHYGVMGTFKEWQQVNLSPNFPVVSSVLLEMYRDVTGERLDGVIALDPIVLGSITKGTGPIPSPEFGTAIDASNAKEILLRDAYELDDFEQNPALEKLIGRFFDALGSSDVDTAGLLEGFGESVTNQHLKVFSNDPGTEELLTQMEIDGWTTAPNMQAVVHMSASSSKVDYFMQRDVDTSVQLVAGGGAEVTTTVTLDNSAIPQPGTELTGPGYPGDPPGLNRMYLNFVMPEGSKLKSFTVDGRRRDPLPEKEDRYPLAWDVVHVLAGESVEATVHYSLPSGSVSTNLFLMTLWPQANVNPDNYSITVTPPPGARIVGIEGPFRQKGVLDREIPIQVQMVGAG